MSLKERLASVRARIDHACRRCGRDPASVTLIGVTKTIPVPIIRDAIDCGLTDAGENRIQEARAKQAELGAGLRWHMIGRLQRNKAKDAVELFEVLHSIDSIELARVAETHAARRGRRPDVLIQVNVSGEPTKSGCAPGKLDGIADEVARLPHLRLAGLMTIAPFAGDPEAARPVFRALRELRDALRRRYERARHLSMGMSHDFEVAIEEGADYVRIGTAIFGERVAD